jgi:hypothetical protein
VNANLSSLDAIDALPGNVRALVRNAFRDGTRWAFISLIPWCAVAVVLSVFMSNIPDPDTDTTEQEEVAVTINENAGNGEKGTSQEV